MTTSDEPRACVMGHRVAYSRSPMLHGHWLRSLGIKGRYDLIDVAPDAFGDFFCSLGRNGYVGGNVTKPHKDAAFRLVDCRDAAAEAVGAVNTVWLDRGRLTGGNTDAEGFVANLDEQTPGWDAPRGRAVVLGAGGASRAVVYALLQRGLEVVIVNRTLAHAERIAEHFGRRTTARGFADLAYLLRDACLIANTTTLGGIGQPALEVDLTSLRSDAVVCDIVYVPLETGLLRAARERGHRVADGLGMLMHQAVPGFAHWFGVTPPVTAELRALLEADIRAKSGPA